MTVETLTAWPTVRTLDGLRGLRQVSINQGTEQGGIPYVGARVSSPPHSMPSISGVQAVSHEWGNEQFITKTVGGWTTVTPGAGVVDLTDRGLRMGAGAYLEGGPLLVGLGHYWEEGILFLESAAQNTYLVTDPGGVFRGRSFIEPDGNGVLRFKHAHANAAGTGSTVHTFDQIAFPVSNFAPGQLVVPIYYRLLRNFVSGGNGLVELRVHYAGQDFVQTFTGIPTPNPVSAAAPRLGSSTAGSVARFLWWRGQGSNVLPASNTFGQSTYWAVPEVFSATPQQFASHGSLVSGFFQAGIDNAFWRSISFPTVLRRGGGKVEARFAATNTVPGGTSQTLMSGPYTELAGVYPDYDLGDIQGRYLAFELRFSRGEASSLGGGDAVFANRPGSVLIDASATWETTARTNPGAGFVELSPNGEGAAEAALPFQPEVVEPTSDRFRRHIFPAEAPYSITRPLGTRRRQTHQMRWVLDAAQFATLRAFFDARRGGEGSFAATPAGEKTLRTFCLLDEQLQWETLHANAYEVRATVEEVMP